MQWHLYIDHLWFDEIKEQKSSPNIVKQGQGVTVWYSIYNSEAAFYIAIHIIAATQYTLGLTPP